MKRLQRRNRDERRDFVSRACIFESGVARRASVGACRLGAAFAATLARWAPWRRAEAGPAIRVMADVGADRTFNVSGAGVGALALSPDGKLLAFSAQQAAGTSQL